MTDWTPKYSFFPEMAETISGSHCTYPRRDGQAEWAWVAWTNTGMVELFIKRHKVVTSEAPFLPRGGRNYLWYSLHLPTEGWPGWVGLSGLDKYRDLFIVMVYCMYSQHVALTTFLLITVFNCNILIKAWYSLFVLKVLSNPSQSIRNQGKMMPLMT